MDNSSVKQNIYLKRIEKGMSQAEVADLMEISQTSYHKIEKGNTSLISDRLIQLASIFNVPETELVFGYLPDSQSAMQKKIEEARIEFSERERKIVEEYNEELHSKDKRIKELEDIVRDKNEIIALLREKIEVLSKVE